MQCRDEAATGRRVEASGDRWCRPRSGPAAAAVPLSCSRAVAVEKADSRENSLFYFYCSCRRQRAELEVTCCDNEVRQNMLQVVLLSIHK